VKLAEKVQRAGLPGYVQLAGGTNNHTVTKLKAAGLLKGWGVGSGEWGVGGLGGLGSAEIVRDTQNYSSPSPYSLPYVAGIAYGSYARVLLSPILDELEKFNGEAVDANLSSPESVYMGRLEELPDLLWQAVAIADSLVSQLKLPQKLPQPMPN
jgi:hypothetical protein